MDNLPWIFISALLVNNFVLTYFLGLCPFLGVSNSLETSFRLGLATTFVMLVTAVCAWVLNTYVLIHAPYLRLISFIVVIASTVQFIEMLIKKLSPALFRSRPTAATASWKGSCTRSAPASASRWRWSCLRACARNPNCRISLN
jgi:Na+-translocating ferredoxin:NAD+ oxidoreductase RnfA subunit